MHASKACNDADVRCLGALQRYWSVYLQDRQLAAGSWNLALSLRSQKTRDLTLRCEQSHRLFVKGNKGFSAEPLAFIGNHAIGKIPASLKH